MKVEGFLTRYRTAIVIGLLLLFGVLYGLLSLGNHVMFRTYGLDLGLYSKALYDYAHLHGNDSSFFLWEPASLLGDHFDLYLMLLSPLVYVFGAYTLLIVQIVAVLGGAYGVYRLMRLYDAGEVVALISMLLLLASFGVWHALGYDYHSNVVATMLLPWLLYAFRRGHYVGATIVAAAIAIAKETSALWLVFVLVAMLFDYWKDRRALRWLLWMTVGAVGYLAVVTLWLMPTIGGTSRGAWRYEWMGGSFAQIASWLITHPAQAVVDVFTNFTDNAGYDALKPEFFICALASGMLLCCFKPNYLLMLIPPLAMKMLSSDAEAFWGVSYHYNVEVCMVSVIGAGITLSRIGSCKWRTAAGISSLVLSVLVLFYSVGNPHTFIRKDNLRIYEARHYRQDSFDVSTARRLIRQIPSEASVCATTMFTPHVALRDSVYIFPMGLGYGADWYLLLLHSKYYYEGEEEQVEKMVNDTVHYHVVDHDEDIYLLVSKDFVER